MQYGEPPPPEPSPNLTCSTPPTLTSFMLSGLMSVVVVGRLPAWGVEHAHGEVLHGSAALQPKSEYRLATSVTVGMLTAVVCFSPPSAPSTLRDLRSILAPKPPLHACAVLATPGKALARLCFPRGGHPTRSNNSRFRTSPASPVRGPLVLVLVYLDWFATGSLALVLLVLLPQCCNFHNVATLHHRVRCQESQGSASFSTDRSGPKSPLPLQIAGLF
jgi:hypothetical protein